MLHTATGIFHSMRYMAGATLRVNPLLTFASREVDLCKFSTPNAFMELSLFMFNTVRLSLSLSVSAS